MIGLNAECSRTRLSLMPSQLLPDIAIFDPREDFPVFPHERFSSLVGRLIQISTFWSNIRMMILRRPEPFRQHVTLERP